MSMTISKKIRDQLGGKLPSFMSGEILRSNSESELSFKLRNGSISICRINHVKITPTSNDLYDMAFGREWGGSYKEIDTAIDICAEKLQKTYMAVTGLDAYF